MTIACACGSVALEAAGTPIAATVCYCDTCQRGSQSLETLPNAPPVRSGDSGTPYVLFRKDRVRIVRGAELLRDLTLDEHAGTRRTYAGCCNAAMMMRFDGAAHWVCIYRERSGDAPPLQFRICTSFRPEQTPLPGDTVNAAMYPPGLMLRLLGSRIAMLLGR